MKRTLYDILGVRQDATNGEIERAYDRMQAMYGGAEGAERAHRDGHSMPLIADAFATLSNSAKRESYDASLARLARQAMEVRGDAAMEAADTMGGRRKWMIAALVALLLGGMYWKSSHDAEVERMRRESEVRRIEAERRAIEAEAERLRAQREQESQSIAAEERRQSAELSTAMARYNAERIRSEGAEAMRAENERRVAERERMQREAAERQRLAQEQRQRQIRDEQESRYLDSFDRRNNQVYIYQLPRR